MVALQGCVSAGDRYANGCPNDEVCSPSTPDGLLFSGPALGDTILDGTIRPVADGGTSHIEILLPGGGFFNLPYLASSSGASLVVTGQDGDEVAIEGAAVGTAWLRITDDANALYDRIQIDTAFLAALDILPALGESLPNAGEIALARGEPASIVVGLRSATGERLIDDSLAVIVNGGPTTVATAAWDTFTVDAAGESASLTFSAGVSDYVVDLPTITALEEILLADEYELSDGYSEVVCFEGRFGIYTVLGVPWEVSIDGMPPVAAIGNCISVEATGPTVTLDVTGLDASQTFVLPVTADATKRAFAKTARAPATVLGTQGERAAAAANGAPVR
ncbi:MAG: hypothetical protein IPL79_19755 [Myxococcales bacterium]|nr:hypothetical protein [Myxococcales bacterium]